MPTADLGEGIITDLPDSVDSTSGTINNVDKDEDKIEVKITEEDSDVVGAKRRRNTYELKSHPPVNVSVARPLGGMKGHTAFLTFAICPEKNAS